MGIRNAMQWNAIQKRIKPKARPPSLFWAQGDAVDVESTNAEQEI